MSNERTPAEKEVHRQKKTFARAICNALINKDKDALTQQLYKIIWEKFDIKEICSLETGDGKSPIRYAITHAEGDTSMLQELKSRGKIDFDVRLAPENMTVLHLAVRVQDKAVLKYLLKHGNVKINGTDSEGETALHCAIRATSVEICSVLLNAGINVNKKDRRQQTALHVALEPLIAFSKQKIELLCKKGASPNAKDANGNTALHLLLKRRPVDFLEKFSILMKQKPEKGIINNDNQTALDLYLDHTDNDPDELYYVNSKFFGKSNSSQHSSPQILIEHAPDDDIESIASSKSASLSRRRSSSNAAKAGKSFIRRLSSSLSISSFRRKSSVTSNMTGMDEFIPDDFEQDDEFPDALERQRRVAAFVQCLTIQKDEEERDVSDWESDLSNSDHDGSPNSKNDGYMTSDDDMRDDESHYSRYADSRRGSFIEEEEEEQSITPEVNGNSFKYLCQNGLDRSSNERQTIIPKHDFCNRTIADTSARIKSHLHQSSLTTLKRASSLSTLISIHAADYHPHRRTSSLQDIREFPIEPITENSKSQAENSDVVISTQDIEASQEWNPSLQNSRCYSFSSAYESDGEESCCGSSTGMRRGAVSMHDISTISDTVDEAMRSSAGEQKGYRRNHKDKVNDDLATTSDRLSTATITAKRSRAGTLTELCDLMQDSDEEIEEVEDPLFQRLNSMSEEDCISYLTSYSSGNLNELRDGNRKESLLHIATRRSFVKLMYFLMAKDIDMNSVDNRGWTSLHVAAQTGNLTIIKMLLSSGANKEVTTVGGNTTVSIATFYGHSVVVSFLLQEGKVSASYLELSLHQILKTRRSKELTHILVRHIESRRQSNDVEVHLVIPLAAKRQHWNVINFILSQQRRKRSCYLELNKRDADGYCAAHYCSMHGSLSMLRKLKNSGASMIRRRKTSSEDGAQTETVLSIAREKGFRDIVNYVKGRKTSTNVLELP